MRSSRFGAGSMSGAASGGGRRRMGPGEQSGCGLVGDDVEREHQVALRRCRPGHVPDIDVEGTDVGVVETDPHVLDT